MDNSIHFTFPFVDFIYILQLEEYDSKRYWNWIQNRLFKRQFQKAGKIVWTKKAKGLLAISLILYLLFTFALVDAIPNGWWMVLSFVIVTFLIPYIVLAANVLLAPVDNLVKRNLVSKAEFKLHYLKNCKIVAIAGSYGKTSTRHFAYQLIKDSFNTHTPQENHNTLLSISQDILKNVNQDTEVYIVELGEYYPGDFKKFINLLNPNIVVITAIGSQHLESFGSQESIDLEFSGLLKASEKSAMLVNSDNRGTARLHLNNPVHQYSTNNLDQFKNIKNKMLGVSPINQNIAGAVTIAKELGVTNDKIEASLEKLTQMDRRMMITHRNGITIIDDTYNINPESATAALDHLKSYDGRKVLVTGGIVDQGDNEEQANFTYGKELSKVVDIVVLANNNLARYIESGISESHPKPILVLSERPTYTPRLLEHILLKGDTVLLQNELPDTYWN